MVFQGHFESFFMKSNKEYFFEYTSLIDGLLLNGIDRVLAFDKDITIVSSFF